VKHAGLTIFPCNSPARDYGSRPGCANVGEFFTPVRVWYRVRIPIKTYPRPRTTITGYRNNTHHVPVESFSTTSHRPLALPSETRSRQGFSRLPREGDAARCGRQADSDTMRNSVCLAEGDPGVTSCRRRIRNWAEPRQDNWQCR
jgi:hypothetical protein